MKRKTLSRFIRLVAVATVAVLAGTIQPALAHPRGHDHGSVRDYHGLSGTQKAALYKIAKDTWKFYGADVDPTTALPLDNLTYAGNSKTPTTYGRYTSSANVGVYLWAIVAAQDLHLISSREAAARANATLTTVSKLKRYKGMLYQWYDTSTGDLLNDPGKGTRCDASAPPAFDNCSLVSNVDNGWYASGLIEVRQAISGASRLASSLLKQMDFSLYYDAAPQSHCNANQAGQMFGAYFVGLPPTVAANYPHYYHNGAFYSDPRIGAYMGMGLHQMPGDVWWKSWRTLPPKAPFADCTTDPDFSWQGQWPTPGKWTTVRDPQSGKKFTVWNGHYTYPGTKLDYIPTFSGGMFEGLMANVVVPETSWGPRSFGKADYGTAAVQIKYTKEQLKLPVWGMSPSSTADDTGGYSGYGVSGQKFPYHGLGATAAHPNQRLAQCDNMGCTPANETTVTPHASFIALDVAPQEAYANIMRMKTQFPDVYGVGGFFDALNPATGAVGHRYLVLDQSMILAALDNALNNRAMQRHFACDPVSRAAQLYLGYDNMFRG